MTRTAAICACVLLGVGNVAWGMDVAAPYVGADFFWDQGYQGAGVEIGIIDLYLADSGHAAIDGNYLGFEKFAKGQTWVSSHATEVAGAALSQDGTYTGVSPEAGWWTAQTANRGSVSSQRKQTMAAETFAQGLGSLMGNPVEVITLSIGMGGNTSGLDQWSLGLDHIISTTGQTITVAAGNDGPGGGSLSGLPVGAFNTILVGATGDTNGDPSQDYSRVVSFSSRGPTTDGRSKPDIVAPGSLLHLPSLGTGWADVDGTSFATPMVAGGAALLIGMGQDLGYSVNSKVIKSVLLNSADKLNGWTATPTQPLDYSQGAGQMDLEMAYSQYLPGQKGPGTVPATGWDIADASWDQESLYRIAGEVLAGETITLTLIWDRLVGTDIEDIEDVVYSLDHLDNLDMYLYDSDDMTTPIASSVSTLDNVEHLYYTVAEAGRYVIGVKMTGAETGDAETYGLAWHTVSQLIPGDANSDDLVDKSDLLILGSNYGLDGLGWADGDFDGDGFVGLLDLDILGQYYGTVGLTADATVPEPLSLSLLAVGGLALLRRRWR